MGCRWVLKLILASFLLSFELKCVKYIRNLNLLGLELKRCNTKARLYFLLELITSYIFQFADELRYVTRKVRYIKAALLSHLVGRLCRYYVPWHERQEDNYVNIFLSTYRSFERPVEMLDLIAKE